MSDDVFALNVQRLAQRHRNRHPPAIVAEVTLQRWLTLRHRYRDPFDPGLFDQIDAVLQRIPATVELPSGGAVDTRTTAAGRRRTRTAQQRDTGLDRPVSRSA